MRSYGIYKDKYDTKMLSIFGHANKGIPGLEIIIPGMQTRYLKEKFVYISKNLGLKFPLKKYTICVDTLGESIKSDHADLNWLELPLLILYWSLAGVLPITKLSDCFCGGKIGVNKKILLPGSLIINNVKTSNDFKVISLSSVQNEVNNCVLSVEEIFSELTQLHFEFEKLNRK